MTASQDEFMMGKPPPKRSYHREEYNLQEGTEEQEPITLPRDVEAALELLGLAGTGQQESTLALPSLAQVRGVYAQFLKEAHPDTATEETSSTQAAQRIAQLTSAFTTVRDFYKKLGLEGSK